MLIWLSRYLSRCPVWFSPSHGGASPVSCGGLLYRIDQQQQQQGEARQCNRGGWLFRTEIGLGSDIYYWHYALWSASTSCGIVLFAMISVAPLNRLLDKPKTLVINSSWISLTPRVPAIALIICLPFIKGLIASSWSGAVTGILFLVFLWEWTAGLESKWKLVEPWKEIQE